jgi:hypothetical protein
VKQLVEKLNLTEKNIDKGRVKIVQYCFNDGTIDEKQQHSSQATIIDDRPIRPQIAVVEGTYHSPSKLILIV